MLKLIIVDDNKDDLLLAERVLRQCKLQNPIRLFQNTTDCLTHLLAADQRNSYSLVLVDLIMEPESGLDLLRQIGSAPVAQQITTVMISGLSDLKAINEGYQLGAKTFLLKPVNRDDVVQVLNSLSDRIVIEQTPEGYRLHHVEEDNRDIDDEARVLSLTK